MSPTSTRIKSNTSTLRIEERPISSLKANPRNARTHSRRQIHQLAASIREFGFNNPILSDEQGQIIAGAGRWEAAKALGLESVPVIELRHLNAAQKRAFTIADNKIPLNAGWNLEILAEELESLSTADLSFAVEITGFETAEIDSITIGSTSSSNSPLDKILPRVAEATSRLNDVWGLGKHKLLCGDARDVCSFDFLMGGERARVAFLDPPYNVPIDGHVCGLGSIKHREFEFAAGELSRAQFIQFLTPVFTNSSRFSLDGAIHYVCMDWRHAEEVIVSSKAAYSEYKNLCVWNKDNGGMGSFYRSKHELIFVFKVGTAPHVNTIELGRSGRYRTNVWDYAGVNTFRTDRLADLALHPTVKPVALVMDAIMDCSRQGDIVLDPFGGSGTSLIAAEKSKRIARVIELDPAYVDVAVRRWQQICGGAAVHLSTGQLFSEMEVQRAHRETGARHD